MKRCLIIVSAFLACLARADEEIATTFTFSSPTATSVEVAGEFNNWKGLPLAKDASGNWSKTVYLKPGQYGYKLIVNGDWIFDPKNSARKTVNDIENSLIVVGDTAVAATGGSGAQTSFSFFEPGAKTVHVAGEFNQWLDNVDGKVSGHSEWLMQNDGAGNWKFSKTLPPGRYKFKYVVDGGERWAQDAHLPSSPEGNSVIEVSNSWNAAPAPVAATSGGNVSFSYADPSARSVSVAGQFNNWSATANPMKKDESGIWSASFTVKPGKYQYKFVIDGDWRQDPTNPDSADDGTGNVNSVRTVAP